VSDHDLPYLKGIRKKDNKEGKINGNAQIESARRKKISSKYKDGKKENEWSNQK
jgi:hypothetical protein